MTFGRIFDARAAANSYCDRIDRASWSSRTFASKAELEGDFRASPTMSVYEASGTDLSEGKESISPIARAICPKPLGEHAIVFREQLLRVRGRLLGDNGHGTAALHIRGWQRRLSQVELGTDRARAQLRHLLKEVESVAECFAEAEVTTERESQFGDQVKRFANDLNDLISACSK